MAAPVPDGCQPPTLGSPSRSRSRKPIVINQPGTAGFSVCIEKSLRRKESEMSHENNIMEETAIVSQEDQPRQVIHDRQGRHRGKSLSTRDLILIAVLLAAGAVLKLTVASFLSFAGMKPNFIIAMYCLAIILIKPRLSQSIAIGIIAGLICQVPMLNATPLVNIPSELLGAIACGLLIALPLKIGKFDFSPAVTTFLSTVVSGYTFAIIVGLMNGIALAAIIPMYAVMVFGTAAMNAVLVQILAPVLERTLK